MAKMAILGHNAADLIDCSEAVPEPVAPVGKDTTYPAQKSFADVEQSCSSPFPTLATDPGQPTIIPECVDGDTNLNDCPS